MLYKLKRISPVIPVTEQFWLSVPFAVSHCGDSKLEAY